ncbi:DUF4174 domain-containing protein [Litoribaculum gwangyangense]|uniref:DUF4174 domain-containing protein n=1 Tax=Litoribaculum gwangyangense TaxID=1130722 RepID=A0ABP9BS01_9FLAO
MLSRIKRIKIIALILLALKTGIMMSQEITDHRWKNRVLLVFTQDINAPNFKKQIDELKKNEKGLKNRKLIIYQIAKDSFRTGFTNLKWEKTPNSFVNFKDKNSTFSIVLIGLDGGIKLKQKRFLSCIDLFNIIDVMPMRQQEIMDNTKSK